MADDRHFESCWMKYLHNRLTDFNEICEGYAYWPSQTAILKTNKCALQNHLTDFNKIWYSVAYWPSRPIQQLNIWSFENPRRRTAADFKTVNAISLQSFDQLQRNFKQVLLKVIWEEHVAPRRIKRVANYWDRTALACCRHSKRV